MAEEVYYSKYKGDEVDALLDKVKEGRDVQVDSSLSTTSVNPVQNKVITDALNDKQDSIADLGTIRSNASKGATAVQPNDLSKVATSGSYSDLSNTPDIPSEITESTVSGWGFTKNVGTYVKPNDGIPKEDLSNAVQESLDKADTALQTHQDISHLATKGELKDKQESLVSGVNIKTINGESVLGEGNIEIKGGGESYDDSELRGLIEGKQDKLEDNVNIKTINGTSLLGSGNIVISGEGGESYDDTELRNMIANKVDKIEGKGLSTEDYTTEEKEKLMSLENYDDSGLKDDISKKQDKLVSGESIKTVNGESILGSGDITIPSESYDDTELRNLIANKADKRGEYLDMSVGLAEDLGNRPFYDEAEFSFRASAGEASVKDGLATIAKLKGNSVVWNQLAHSFDENHWRNNNANYHDLSFDNGVAIATAKDVEIPYNYSWSIASRGEIHAFYANHKYLIVLDYYESVALGNGLLLYMAGEMVGLNYAHTNDWQTLSRFYTPSTDSTSTYLLYYPVITPNTNYNGEVWKMRKFRITDLTQMFGAGNEPSTIEEFNARKPIVEDEYAYNEGEVIHMTAEGIKSVGDNAWDEEWELGKLNNTTGEPQADNTVIRSKNYTRVIPNETYFFYGHYGWGTCFYDADKNYITTLYVNTKALQIPSNAMYLKFNFPTDYGTTYKGDYMITLVHSGWKQDTDAGYQPYWEDRLIFDQRIKDEFPNGMSKWDMVYNKNGKGYIVKGTGVVDMGELAWGNAVNAGWGTGFSALIAGGKNDNSKPCAITSRYNGVDAHSLYSSNKSTDCIIAIEDGTTIRIHDNAYTDAATFKAAMAGVPLYYELAEPTIIEYDEPFNLDYRVADFGTEQAIAETNSAPISAKIEYGFGANDTIRTNKLAISALKKELRDSYATTQSVREAIEEAITTTLNTEV